MIMDRHFLELWGTLLLNASKGQKQVEDLVKLMGGDLSSFEDISEMFGKIYGIDFFSKNTPEYMDTWKKATENFNTASKDFLAMMDLVPRKDYLELLRQNEELRKNAAEHEEYIAVLKKILDKQLADQKEGFKGYESLIQDQGDQFKELIERFSHMFSLSSPAASGSGKKNTKKGEPSTKSSSSKPKNASSSMKATARGKKT